MKKGMLYVIIFVFTFPVFAQAQFKQLSPDIRNHIIDLTFALFPEDLVKEITATNEVSKPVFEYFGLQNPFEKTNAPYAEQWIPDSIRLYSMVDSVKKKYTYAEDGMILEELQLAWNGSEWANSKRITYEYAAKRKVIRVTEDLWEFDHWAANIQREYSYVNQVDTIKAPGGSLTDVTWMIILYSTWDGTQFQNTMRVTYGFNEYDMLTTYWTENKIDGTWTPEYKHKNIYDMYLNLMLSYFQSWNVIGWLFIGKESYSYDAQNRMTGSISQSYEDNLWVNTWKSEYEWAGENKTRDVEKTWNGADWENFQQIEYAYNGANKKISEVRTNWSGSSWDPDQRSLYTWVGENQTERIWEVYSLGNYTPNKRMTFDFLSGSIDAKYWLWDGSVWIPDLIGTSLIIYSGEYTYYLGYGNEGAFYYSRSVDVDDENFFPENFSVTQNYPNPFNPSTSFLIRLQLNSYVAAAVYSVTGEMIRIIVSAQYTSGEHVIHWDASSLPSGVYFVRFEVSSIDGNKEITRTIKSIKLN